MPRTGPLADWLRDEARRPFERPRGDVGDQGQPSSARSMPISRAMASRGIGSRSAARLSTSLRIALTADFAAHSHLLEPAIARMNDRQSEEFGLGVAAFGCNELKEAWASR